MPSDKNLLGFSKLFDVSRSLLQIRDLRRLLFSSLYTTQATDMSNFCPRFVAVYHPGSRHKSLNATG